MTQVELVAMPAPKEMSVQAAYMGLRRALREHPGGRFDRHIARFFDAPCRQGGAGRHQWEPRPGPAGTRAKQPAAQRVLKDHSQPQQMLAWYWDVVQSPLHASDPRDFRSRSIRSNPAIGRAERVGVLPREAPKSRSRRPIMVAASASNGPSGDSGAHPPAMAPTMRNGSSPAETASGSGLSGGS